jgi:RNA polymerase sigma-70 factor (ECF subfamily)
MMPAPFARCAAALVAAATPASPTSADRSAERDQASERLVGLLSRVALGDRQAFRGLYEATSAHLLGVAFEVLHHRERAEEVLQECYLTVWNAAGRYDAATARPMTWLINIVRNRAIDALRAQRSRQHLSLPLDDALTETVVDLAPRPEQQLQRAVAEARIEAGLATLSRHERQAVALVIYRGMTHAEIAAQCQVPLSTAKSWVRRGLMRLKDQVDAAGRRPQRA